MLLEQHGGFEGDNGQHHFMEATFSMGDGMGNHGNSQAQPKESFSSMLGEGFNFNAPMPDNGFNNSVFGNAVIDDNMKFQAPMASASFDHNMNVMDMNIDPALTNANIKHEARVFYGPIPPPQSVPLNQAVQPEAQQVDAQVAAIGTGKEDSAPETETRMSREEILAFVKQRNYSLQEFNELPVPVTRDDQDIYLLVGRSHNVPYGKIKKRGQYDMAESTLRGRHRFLEKAPSQRPRRPKWSLRDAS